MIDIENDHVIDFLTDPDYSDAANVDNSAVIAGSLLTRSKSSNSNNSIESFLSNNRYNPDYLDNFEKYSDADSIYDLDNSDDQDDHRPCSSKEYKESEGKEDKNQDNHTDKIAPSAQNAAVLDNEAFASIRAIYDEQIKEIFNRQRQLEIKCDSTMRMCKVAERICASMISSQQSDIEKKLVGLKEARKAKNRSAAQAATKTIDRSELQPAAKIVAQPTVATANPKGDAALPKVATAQPKAVAANSKVDSALPKVATANSKVATASPKYDKMARSRSGTSEAGRFSKLFTRENPYYTPQAGAYVFVKGRERRNTKRKFSTLKMIRNLAVLFILLLMIPVAYTISVIAAVPKIDTSNINEDIKTRYEADRNIGKNADKLRFGDGGTLVKYDQLPQKTVDAFVAFNDKDFWGRRREAKDIIADYCRQFIGGKAADSGSTIPRMLANNVYMSQYGEKSSVKRGIIEIYYSSRIERSLTKKEIMAAYLNSLYFGFKSCGIGQAARTYFSSDVASLTLEQSAALATIPQSPDAYALIKTPGSNPPEHGKGNSIKVNDMEYLLNDSTEGRIRLCLGKMFKQGYIDKKTFEKISRKDIRTFIKPSIQ